LVDKGINPECCANHKHDDGKYFTSNKNSLVKGFLAIYNKALPHSLRPTQFKGATE
jgi:hypothetical protein